jgi:anti-sigma regulatory factor (Ser/Thr protein kinase)
MHGFCQRAAANLASSRRVRAVTVVRVGLSEGLSRYLFGMPASTRAASERPEVKQQSFAPVTSSIAETRRFVRECVAPLVTDRIRLGDIELATSELVTNAVEHGAHDPVTVGVETTANAIVVAVTSSRASGAMGEPSSWSGPLPAMRTGRGLAIVRAVSDEIEVDAGDDALTIRCTFRLTPST